MSLQKLDDRVQDMYSGYFLVENRSANSIVTSGSLAGRVAFLLKRLTF